MLTSMKIVIDGRMADWSGIGRYTLELVSKLTRLDTDNTYVILMLPKDRHLFGNLPSNFSLGAVNIQPYSLREQLVLGNVIAKLKPDLVHFVHFTVPLTYRGKYVVTIHDLTLIDYKTNRGNGLGRLKFEAKHLLMRAILRHALQGAQAIITDTEFVKAELARRYRYPGLETKIRPIPLAASPILAEADPIIKFNLGATQFLLYVGNYYPNKNVGRLVEGFELLQKTKPGLKLVLVGREDYFLKELMKEVKQKNLSESVIITGRTSDGELTGLYHKAALFVFPSLAEGFGLPPLEAMAHGTAVISSNASCMPEVLGDAAAYFDPTNPRDMADKIASLLGDPEELDRLKKAGVEQVKHYSWIKMAEETLEVYQRVLSE